MAEKANTRQQLPLAIVNKSTYVAKSTPANMAQPTSQSHLHGQNKFCTENQLGGQINNKTNIFNG
jgi:hypothetical protein